MLTFHTMLLALFFVCAQLLEAYEIVSLPNLSLNREAFSLCSEQLAPFHNASFGFSWNDEDASTLKWRPQGITATVVEEREFVLVSWYGRSEEDYANRGVRISCVDITSASNILYRHVLLVDENYETFDNMHAGGLVLLGNLLHVPDSRSGAKRVYTFDINKMLYIPESDRDSFYNYVYILPRIGAYDVPITPSFLSFDWNHNQIILGTFYQCSSSHSDSTECMSNTNNRLMWYTDGEVSGSSPYCSPFFSEMQGAASAHHPTSDNTVLWTSSSYGSSHESHLHINSVRKDINNCEGVPLDISNYRVQSYPPGVEDLHVSGAPSKYANYLWMQTEFGSNDGADNIRRVVATDVNYLLP